MLEHGVVPAAAQAVGVSERTMRRWVAKPAFKSALVNARQGLMDGLASKLASGVQVAEKTLRSIMENEKASDTARANAARVYLESARGVVSDSDVSGRLKRLEGRTKGRDVEGGQHDAASSNGDHGAGATLQ